MTVDVTRLLDDLEAAHAAATPGPWENPRPFTKLIDAPGSTDNLAIVQCDNAAEAALIVAAVNVLPQLVAAVRAGLALADELDQELVDRGVLLDRVIRPGDRLRTALSAPLAGQHTTDEQEQEQ